MKEVKVCLTPCLASVSTSGNNVKENLGTEKTFFFSVVDSVVISYLIWLSTKVVS